MMIIGTCAERTYKSVLSKIAFFTTADLLKIQ